MYGSVNFVRKTLQFFNEQICQSWGFSTCAVQRVAGHLAEIFHSLVFANVFANVCLMIFRRHFFEV